MFYLSRLAKPPRKSFFFMKQIGTYEGTYTQLKMKHPNCLREEY